MYAKRGIADHSCESGRKPRCSGKCYAWLDDVPEHRDIGDLFGGRNLCLILRMRQFESGARFATPGYQNNPTMTAVRRNH